MAHSAQQALEVPQLHPLLLNSLTGTGRAAALPTMPLDLSAAGLQQSMAQLSSNSRRVIAAQSSASSAADAAEQLNRGKWTAEEDDELRKAVEKYGARNWKIIAGCLGNRTDVQCLHRWQKVLRPGLVKGPWTSEEDDKVKKLVAELGTKRWSAIAAQLPGRLGKQCRERWYNHLDPAIKRGPWTPEEDKLIITLQHTYGNKWADIASEVPGRTDNAIKNRWNSTLYRILKKVAGECEKEGVPPPSTVEEKVAVVKQQLEVEAAAQGPGRLRGSAAEDESAAASGAYDPAYAYDGSGYAEDGDEDGQDEDGDDALGAGAGVSASISRAAADGGDSDGDGAGESGAGRARVSGRPRGRPRGRPAASSARSSEDIYEYDDTIMRIRKGTRSRRGAPEAPAAAAESAPPAAAAEEDGAAAPAAKRSRRKDGTSQVLSVFAAAAAEYMDDGSGAAVEPGPEAKPEPADEPSAAVTVEVPDDVEDDMDEEDEDDPPLALAGPKLVQPPALSTPLRAAGANGVASKDEDAGSFDSVNGSPDPDRMTSRKRSRPESMPIAPPVPVRGRDSTPRRDVKNASATSVLTGLRAASSLLSLQSPAELAKQAAMKRAEAAAAAAAASADGSAGALPAAVKEDDDLYAFYSGTGEAINAALSSVGVNEQLSIGIGMGLAEGLLAAASKIDSSAKPSESGRAEQTPGEPASAIVKLALSPSRFPSKLSSPGSSGIIDTKTPGRLKNALIALEAVSKAAASGLGISVPTDKKGAFSTPGAARGPASSGHAVSANFMPSPHPEFTPLGKVSPSSAANAIGGSTPAAGLISRLLNTSSSAAFVAGAGYAFGVQYGHQIASLQEQSSSSEDVVDKVSATAGIELSKDYVRYGAAIRLGKHGDAAADKVEADTDAVGSVMAVFPGISEANQPSKIKEVVMLRHEGAARGAAMRSPDRPFPQNSGAGAASHASSPAQAAVGSAASVAVPAAGASSTGGQVASLASTSAAVPPVLPFPLLSGHGILAGVGASAATALGPQLSHLPSVARPLLPLLQGLGPQLPAGQAGGLGVIALPALT